MVGWVDGWMGGNRSWFKGLLCAVQNPKIFLQIFLLGCIFLMALTEGLFSTRQIIMSQDGYNIKFLFHFFLGAEQLFHDQRPNGLLIFRLFDLPSIPMGHHMKIIVRDMNDRDFDLRAGVLCISIRKQVLCMLFAPQNHIFQCIFPCFLFFFCPIQKREEKVQKNTHKAGVYWHLDASMWQKHTDKYKKGWKILFWPSRGVRCATQVPWPLRYAASPSFRM